jgi:GT2 family glycosyltransferase
MPQVSVVIPTFGRSELVARAVAGVAAQTLTDIEIIVVVDGNDPQTVAKLAGITDRRLRVLVNAQQAGAGRARDRGVQESRADWVAFLDDDDEWLPTKLERQMAVAQNGPVIISTLSWVIAPYGKTVMPIQPYDGSVPFDEWMFDRRSWLKRGEGFLQTSSILAPRDLLLTLPFAGTRHEEWELVLRATKQFGMKVLTVHEPLVLHYRDQARPSLSHAYGWQRSLDWANSLGTLLSPRGYSGFLLTVVSRDAQGRGAKGAAVPLLKAAWQKGRPTARQLFAFLSIWGMPRNLRRKLRGLLDRGRRSGNKA